ncbi:MAG: LysM peptidoglycan-binding domain-containing protein [Myxococcaceae bacterium]|nr:LysM peptidoglycan-binding domain-containing protein [Myxococcaceae bacterium]
MPPPPPGMRLVAHVAEVELDAGVAVTAVTPAEPPPPPPSTTPRADDEDDPESELDAMKAIEEETFEVAPLSGGDSAVRAAVQQLGAGTLVRDRLDQALDQADWSGEELPFELARVGDVSTFDVSLVRDRYDIPVEMHPLVAQYIRFFQGPGRRWFRRWMSRSHRYIPLMQPILESKGLPRDTVYLAMIESGFNTQAKSWARAVGPWQFIAGTAKMFHLKEDFWVDERRDPVKATHAAAAYLSLLYQTLGHWYLAWAGYNTGGGRVRNMIERSGSRDFWELSELKKGFAKETKHYVPKLIACALVARHPEAFGFSQDEFDPEGPFEFDEVALTDSVDLEVLATSAGVSIDDLRELNPELKRWCTPPATPEQPYVLRIPKGRKASFDETFGKYAPQERLHFKIHRVEKGDTLSKIALKYRSAQEAIMRMNGLTSARSLKLGTDLVVPVPSAAAMKAGKNDTALERQIARARRSGLAAARPEDEIPAGTQSGSGKIVTGGTVTVETVGGKTKVTYGVAKGDSLWTIARRFDVRVAELKTWNEVLTSNRLKVGLALVVWPGANADLTGSSSATAAKNDAPKPAAGAAPKGTKHTVASGDTLWSIAQKYGASVADLKSWNSLDTSKLKKGQVLVVAAP